MKVGERGELGTHTKPEDQQRQSRQLTIQCRAEAESDLPAEDSAKDRSGGRQWVKPASVLKTQQAGECMYHLLI